MANLYWIGGTGGNEHNWATNANWSTGTAPADGDNVVIDGRGTTYIDGSDQSAIEPATLRIYSSFSFNIGSASTPLKIGPLICDIGLPAEDGSQSGGPSTIALDFTTDPVVCTVHNANPQGEAGSSCVLVRGVNASNVLTVKSGSVGLATMLPNEAATWPLINVLGDNARLVIGYGATLTTINQKAGVIVSSSAFTTLNQDGGTLTTEGAGAVTTANILGNFIPNSTGTVTNTNISGAGFMDASQSATSRVFTNVVVYGASATINADCNNATSTIAMFPNGIDCLQGAKTSQINLGDAVTVTPSAP